MSEDLVGESHDIELAFAGLEAAVDQALALCLDIVSSVGLTTLLDRGEVLSRRFEALQRGLVATIDRRGVAGEYGSTSTAALIGQRLRLSQYDSSARVRQAREFAPRVALTGEVLPPLFAPTAAALDTGEISLAHAKVVARTRSALPAEIDAQVGDEAERLLVEQARHLNPTQLSYVATRLLDTLNPDGKFDALADQERKRQAALIDLPGGASKPTGYYTPELTAILKPIFESLAAPQPMGDLPDPRTPGQRMHDGLIEFGLRILRSGGLPDSGGVPVSILVTATDDDMAKAEQGEDVLVHDAYGTPLPLSTFLELGGELEFTAVRLSCSGGIVSFGQTRRLATIGQRRALAARDRGCSFPGCTRNHAWAEVHHIKEWLSGGGTDLNNLVLLCRFHHRHFASAGWAVRMRPDGVPEWLPPAWLDEERKPRRNTAHDRPLLPLLT